MNRADVVACEMAMVLVIAMLIRSRGCESQKLGKRLGTGKKRGGGPELPTTQKPKRDGMGGSDPWTKKLWVRPSLPAPLEIHFEELEDNTAGLGEFDERSRQCSIVLRYSASEKLSAFPSTPMKHLSARRVYCSLVLGNQIAETWGIPTAAIPRSS